MLFLLATPEYNNVQSNTTKVRVHLRSGIAEIFEQHQDLMGKIDNNIVEIETNFENKLEKIWFVLQDAVFIVSNQKGDSAASAFENEGTGVYIYAKRVKEINSSVSMEELSKQYDEKVSLFEAEKQKLVDENIDVSDETSNSKLMVIKDEIDFIKKVMAVIKDFKG
jgi:F0F1-type ATP synthase epsilon subunit